MGTALTPYMRTPIHLCNTCITSRTPLVIKLGHQRGQLVCRCTFVRLGIFRVYEYSAFDACYTLTGEAAHSTLVIWFDHSRRKKFRAYRIATVYRLCSATFLESSLVLVVVGCSKNPFPNVEVNYPSATFGWETFLIAQCSREVGLETRVAPSGITIHAWSGVWTSEFLATDQTLGERL